MTFARPSRQDCVASAEIRDGDATVGVVRVEGDIPGLFVLDVICRVSVAARRLGWSVHADAETSELLALAGIEERREPERREQRGVEEVVQLDESSP